VLIRRSENSLWQVATLDTAEDRASSLIFKTGFKTWPGKAGSKTDSAIHMSDVRSGAGFAVQAPVELGSRISFNVHAVM
jgi:hypothetical protein